MNIKQRIQELSLDQKAKLYFMGLVRQGKIDRLEFSKNNFNAGKPGAKK